MTRTQVQALAQGNAKFVQALFCPESIQSRRNTEAIDIGRNALMAGRIVDYKPAAPRALDDVQDEIRKQLERKAARTSRRRSARKSWRCCSRARRQEAGVTFGSR